MSHFIIFFCCEAFAAKKAASFCTQFNKESFEIHGHRGSGLRPENIMSAFVTGAKTGATVVEMDLQLSQDNVVIVAHDNYLRPDICLAQKGAKLDPQKPIHFRNLSYEEIKKYDCGSLIRPGQTAAPGEYPPRLVDVLKTIGAMKNTQGRPMKVNIEIKFDPLHPEFYASLDEYATLISKAVDESRLPNAQMMFQSFSVEILKAIKLKRPAAILSPLVGDEKVSLLNVTSDLKSAYVTPQFALIDAAKIRALHRKEVKIVPWTVDDPKDFERALTEGVDGIITNHPEIFLKFIQEKCGVELQNGLRTLSF